MRILAIESSCDETAAAVIEDGRKMLSNVVDTQIATHALYGGVVPEIASRRHMEAVVRVTEQALADAKMDKHEVDAVAATCAPGLIGALLVGANFGKSLAFAMNKPFIPVHHIRGHIAATYLAYPELKPPFLTLIASGGHSEIVMVQGLYRVRDPRRHARRRRGRGVRQGGARARASAIPAARRSTRSRRTATRSAISCPTAASRMRRSISRSPGSRRRSSTSRTTPSRRAKRSTGRALRPRSARRSCIRSCRASRRRCIRRTRAMWSARAASRRIPSCAQRSAAWRSARTRGCSCRRSSSAATTPP